MDIQLIILTAVIAAFQGTCMKRLYVYAYFVFLFYRFYLTVLDTTALQCYTCSYYKLDSGDSIIQTPVQVLIDRISTPSCQFRNEGDENRVNIRWASVPLFYNPIVKHANERFEWNFRFRECPDPSDGYEAKCVVAKGTVDATFNLVISK